MTDKEIELLRELRSGSRQVIVPITPRIQSLVDRGYCKLSKGLTGPLAMHVPGDIMVSLTEAGRKIADDLFGVKED